MTTNKAVTQKLSAQAWDALIDAFATFWWYKDDLKRFLYHQLREDPTVLARLDFSLPKRQIASSLVGQLARDEARYQGIAIDMLVELSKFDATFPKLASLDDGAQKVQQAQLAHAAVARVIGEYGELAKQRKRLQQELDERTKSDAARRSHGAILGGLREFFFAMHAMSDAHARGRDFERFLNELFELHDLQPRAAYNLEHEQIDGAFTFDTDDYLLEAKWWKEPLQPQEVHAFKGALDSKAKHTLGLLIAVNGFTAGAVDVYSRATPLIFMDGADLVPILEARITLTEVLLRKRRHAAETGNPMYQVTKMIG